MTQDDQPLPLEEKAIYADSHSLFWETVPQMFEPISGNPDEPLLYQEQPEYTIWKLFVSEFLEENNGIQRIINKLQTAQPGDVLEFHISSRGGSADELIELFNLCNSMFYGRVTTFMNYGYSAGSLAFLFGSDRVIYKHSDFMIHSYSGGFIGKRDDMLKHMKHEDRRLTNFNNELLKPYFSKKEMKQIKKGKDFWFNSEEMLRRGIATHIIVNGEVFTKDEYLEVLQPGYKKEQEELFKEAKKEIRKEKKAEKKAEKKEKAKNDQPPE